MDTWVIVLIVIAVVVVVALIALVMSKRSGVAQAKKREQAREHLQEAQVRTAQADKEQALAEEQAARARRERAEVQERTALSEHEARDRAARAGESRSEAEKLRAKAEKLAPGLADGHAGHHRAEQEQGAPVAADRAPADQQLRPDEPGGGATRR